MFSTTAVSPWPSRAFSKRALAVTDHPRVNNSLSETYTNIQATGSGFLDKYQFSGGSRLMQFVLKLTY